MRSGGSQGDGSDGSDAAGFLVVAERYNGLHNSGLNDGITGPGDLGSTTGELKAGMKHGMEDLPLKQLDSAVADASPQLSGMHRFVLSTLRPLMLHEKIWVNVPNVRKTSENNVRSIFRNVKLLAWKR